jgi:hypothetical protein
VKDVHLHNWEDHGLPQPPSPFVAISPEENTKKHWKIDWRLEPGRHSIPTVKQAIKEALDTFVRFWCNVAS